MGFGHPHHPQLLHTPTRTHIHPPAHTHTHTHTPPPRNVLFHTSMVQVKLFHTFSLISHVLQKLDKHPTYFTPNKFPSGNFTQPTFISHAVGILLHLFTCLPSFHTCAWLYITRQCVAMRFTSRTMNIFTCAPPRHEHFHMRVTARRHFHIPETRWGTCGACLTCVMNQPVDLGM